MANGFWIAVDNGSGARVSASDTMLSPAPVDVNYPGEPAGTRIDTADGRLIVQQPAADARVREWIWKGYPADFAPYLALWNNLERLRSSLRKDAGASPYIWVKDNITGQLYYHDLYPSGVLISSSDATHLSIATTPWSASAYIGYTVEVLTGTGAGQLRTVTANTNQQLTVTPAWTVQPGAGLFTVRGRAQEWFRARVVGAVRKVRDGGGAVRFDETRFQFVIEDSTHTPALG